MVTGVGTALPSWLRVLPRKTVSRAVGGLARLPLPPLVLVPVLAAYSGVYGVDLEEADRSLGQYRSFLDFFTRRLRRGLRPLPSDPRAIAAPCDGRVHAAGRIEREGLVEAKGVVYSLTELLGDADAGRTWRGGTHLAVHLGPGDYHRFHWPFDGFVDTVRHLPGDLWPVHPGALRRLPHLLARNERVAVEGRLPGGGRFAVVAIGALNVGSIRLAFLEVRTNRGAPAQPRTFALDRLPFRRGEEMGFFEMGSALVLLLEEAAGALVPLERGRRVRALEAIGRLA